MMPEFSSVAARPCASRIAFMATSHGWFLISADTVPGTALPRTIVRPEYSAKVARTSWTGASSHVIEMRRACDRREPNAPTVVTGIGRASIDATMESVSAGARTGAEGSGAGGGTTGAGGGTTRAGGGTTGAGADVGATDPVAMFSAGSDFAASG